MGSRPSRRSLTTQRRHTTQAHPEPSGCAFQFPLMDETPSPPFILIDSPIRRSYNPRHPRIPHREPERRYPRTGREFRSVPAPGSVEHRTKGPHANHSQASRHHRMPVSGPGSLRSAKSSCQPYPRRRARHQPSPAELRRRKPHLDARSASATHAQAAQARRRRRNA